MAYTKKGRTRRPLECELVRITYRLELIVDAGAKLLRVMQSANTGMTRYTAFSS